MVPVSFFLQPEVLDPRQVRMALQRDAPELLLGSILAMAGLLTIVLFLARNRRTDRALLWFGLFTAAYGLRLLMGANTFQFAAEPIPRQTWRYLISGLTYALPLVITLFFHELFPQWNRVTGWLARALAVLPVAGIATDVFLHRPESLHLLNNFVVILGVAALAAALYRHARTTRIGPLHIGTAILFVTVLVNNLLTAYQERRPMLLTLMEPFGFLCFIAALGTTVARDLFRREEQLVEISKELEVARRIQNSILPRELPVSPHLQTAARYLPMTAVAGDFYDFLPVGETATGFLIADVSGHGVPAALIASMVKLAIAAQLPHADNPALVLQGMNRLLCGKMQGQFVSAAYLYLDPAAGIMRYAAAGHPSLLACHEGQIDAISENGLLLGIFPHAAYTAQERALQRGTRFLLYTDGIIEAGNKQDEFFGEERVVEQLLTTRALSADQAAESLIDRVGQWIGPNPQDDVTLLVVDVT